MIETYSKTSQLQKNYIRSLAFSPLDNSIIIYGDLLGNIFELNRKTKSKKVIGKFENSVVDIKFSRSGKYLSVGGIDGKAKIWQCQKSLCQELSDIKIDSHIYSLSFSEDEKKLAVAGLDEKIYLWDMKKMQLFDNYQPTILSAHKGSIRDMVFTQNFLVSVSDDQTMRFWYYQSNKNLLDNYLKYSCRFLQDYLNQSKYIPKIPEWFNNKDNCSVKLIKN